MAVNNNPVFQPGQNIPPELLKQWLDRAALGTMEWMPATESSDAAQVARNGWYDTSIGKFSPVVQRQERMQQTGNGESTEWTGTGLFDTRIYQPRNVSNFGANDLSDVFDEQGRPIGVSGGMGDLRGLATIAAMALGGYGASMGGTAGAVGTGALKGAATGAMAAGVTDRDLSTGMLSGAAGGALTGGINAYGAEQGWSPAATKAVSAGANTALRGGDGSDILKSGLLAGAGTLADNATPAANISTGSGGMFTLDPSLYPDLNGVDTNQLLTDNAFDGSNVSFDFSNTNGLTNPYDFGFDPSLFEGGGQQGGDWMKLVKSLFTKTGSDGQTSMNGMLPLLLGGILGAQGGKDRQATDSKAPWAPMQPYLLGLAQQGADINQKLMSQPFNAAQKAGYSNLGGLLDLYGQQAAGLLQGPGANASGANQFRRGQPQQGLLGTNFRMWGNPQSFGNFGT